MGCCTECVHSSRALSVGDCSSVTEKIVDFCEMLGNGEPYSKKLL